MARLATRVEELSIPSQIRALLDAAECIAEVIRNTFQHRITANSTAAPAKND